jgi:hypothetical protein
MKTMRAALIGLIVLCASATTAVADDPQAWLDAHNRQRAIHCVPALTWSNEVAASAQAWANQCTLSHENQHVYGENLFWGTAGAYSPDSAVMSWYGENSNYNYANPVFSPTTGHFTQVIWKSTAAIGCATAHCGGVDYFVCRYSAPGNVAGQFAENVPRPMSCESVPHAAQGTPQPVGPPETVPQPPPLPVPPQPVQGPQSCQPPLLGTYPNCYQPAATCPPLRKLGADNKCHCFDGTMPVNGLCLDQPASACPQPQKLGADNKCHCPDGTLPVNGQCVVQPASACPPLRKLGADNKCHCFDGTMPVNGLCLDQPASACPQPQKLGADNKCHCPDGTLPVNGQCSAHTGQKGTNPSQLEVACPRPATGILPNCKCPSPLVWHPNAGCVLASGPKGAPPPTQPTPVGPAPKHVCSSGTVGTYPNCVRPGAPCGASGTYDKNGNCVGQVK